MNIIETTLLLMLLTLIGAISRSLQIATITTLLLTLGLEILKQLIK